MRIRCVHVESTRSTDDCYKIVIVGSLYVRNELFPFSDYKLER